MNRLGSKPGDTRTSTARAGEVRRTMPTAGGDNMQSVRRGDNTESGRRGGGVQVKSLADIRREKLMQRLGRAHVLLTEEQQENVDDGRIEEEEEEEEEELKVIQVRRKKSSLFP